ncbi:MAG: DUF4375 domain-containing protein [Promethearchaeota archaeon]
MVETNSKIDELYQLAVKLSREKKYEEAITQFRKVIHLNSEHHLAWHNLGNVLHKNYDYLEAINCFKKALGLNPNNSSARSKLRDLKWIIKENDEIIEYQKKSINTISNNKHFKISKAQIIDLKDVELIDTLIEPIIPSIGEKELLHILEGTPGQRALYSVILFMREVDNGGIAQFLRNSSGKYINEVLFGLELIQASDHLRILREAITIFPQSKLPLETHKRNDILDNQLDKLQKEDQDYFHLFDEKLFGEERLYPLILDYIENNKEDFFYD